MSGERLTPDITIRGRMPTPQEYKKHLELLEDVEAGGTRVFNNWTGRDMTDLQHEVWIAAARGGLMKQDHDYRWVLTPYGKVYLSQRVPPKRKKRKLKKLRGTILRKRPRP